MFLRHAHRVIEDCQDHIKSNPDLNPAIEVYLAAYANLQLCADIERKLVELFSNGLAAKCQGEVATEFISSACKSRVRNATYKGMCDMFNHFGLQQQQEFQETVHKELGNKRIETLASTVTARNRDSHGEPQIQSSMTEVVSALEVAEAMLGIASRVIEGD